MLLKKPVTPSRQTYRHTKVQQPSASRQRVGVFAAASNAGSLDNGKSASNRAPAATAAIFTGTYATIAGAALVLAPTTVFGLLFDAAAVPTGWIRFGGILLATFGVQYLGAGLLDKRGDTAQAQGAVSFYRATIWSRLFLVAGCAALAVSRELPMTVLLLAALNMAGATSMALALRKQAAESGQQAAGADTAEMEASISDCNPLGM
mmetsp:Transcript_38377/g.85453  ORF Transcript_38377/g.85453 Transcript_38377/m.85453 type:complete len:206 (+) Transcript_38377:42-659(+)